MCLIGIAYRHVPGYRLVVLANRDEFHHRPTTACHWWNDPPLLAGRDEEAGGTWLGVRAGGRLAAVTNYREVPPEHGSRSRGELPVRFLSDNGTAGTWSEDLCGDGGREYGGFNVILFDGEALYWTSNRSAQSIRLEPGVHALSNHLLNTEWPKVRRIRHAMRDMGELDVAACIDWLNDRDIAADSELPDTGVGVDRERLLAPIHIINEFYGTRSSSVVGIADDGRITFTEVSYDRAGEEIGRVDFEVPAAGIDS